MAATLTVATSVRGATAGDDPRPAQLEAARGLAHAERFEEAIDRYHALLAGDPRNADARAGLVDALIWSGRLDEADRELDVGLAYERDVPALLARRARVLHLRGEVALGRPYLERAERARPGDDDLRVLGDRMWLGEARFRLRQDFYPQGWDDLPSAEASVLQRLGRALIGVRSEQSSRFPSAYGVRAYNAFYAASAAYTVAPGWVPGVEAGFGAPARAIPDWLARGFVYFPIGLKLGGPLDGYGAVAWMHYPTNTTVQLINPVLGVSLGERWRVEARYWLARATAPGADPTYNHSAGARATFRPVRQLGADAHWVFGAQADRLPNVDQLASIRSHFFGIALDMRPVRELGIRPLYELELRRNPRGDLINIHGAEIGVYARW